MKNAFKYGAVTLGLLLGLGSSVHAASSWVFTGSSTADGLGDGGVVANTSYSNSVASLTVSGAYAANGTSNSGYATGATWQTAAPNATLNYYAGNGLAMCSLPSTQGCGAPDHALDNNGTTEAVLFNFGSTKVDLTSIGIGYVSGSADISVFEYTGTSAPTMTSAGASLSAMTAAGWSLVNNYANLSQNDSTFNLINGATGTGVGTNCVTNASTNNEPVCSTIASTASSTSVGSSWWLVTAYNTSYGASGINEATGTATTIAASDEGSSYFKIYGVAGSACTSNCGSTTTKVPEPGSMALAGVALLGIIGTRRRQPKKSV